MSELIVIGYPDENTADNVWQELVKLQQDYLIDLEDAAIIRRDAKGKLHVTTPAHHAVAWGTLSGLFWGRSSAYCSCSRWLRSWAPQVVSWALPSELPETSG
jgi:uncharacterized membrane protein